MIQPSQLEEALQSFDARPFHKDTVRSLFRACDIDNNRQVDYREFQSLWIKLLQFRSIFKMLDSSKCGLLAFDNYYEGLQELGFTLSRGFLEFYYWKHVPRPAGAQANAMTPAMTFDHFVQSCVNLERMTQVFRGLDTGKKGTVSLPFEQFISGMSYLI